LLNPNFAGFDCCGLAPTLRLVLAYVRLQNFAGNYECTKLVYLRDTLFHETRFS
jgi:hypothetical protein